jgi:hypothetical protein
MGQPERSQPDQRPGDRKVTTGTRTRDQQERPGLSSPGLSFSYAAEIAVQGGVLGAKHPENPGKIRIFPVFSGDFQRSNLTMREILGLKIFHTR